MVRSVILFSLLLLANGSDIKGKARPKTKWFESKQLRLEEKDEKILSPAFRQEVPEERTVDVEDTPDIISSPPRWPEKQPAVISSPARWPKAPESGSLGPAFIEPPPAPVPEPASVVAANYNPPAPYSFGYVAELDDGRSSRTEESNGQRVQGSYALASADGISRTVYYVADQDGFRAHIVTNEPGTESRNPSGIMMKSSQLPAEEITWQMEPHRLQSLSSPSHRINENAKFEAAAAHVNPDFRSATHHAPIGQLRRELTDDDWRSAPVKGGLKRSQPLRRIEKVTKSAPAPVKGGLKRTVLEERPIQRLIQQEPVKTELRWEEPIAYKIEIPKTVHLERKVWTGPVEVKGGRKAPPPPPPQPTKVHHVPRPLITKTAPVVKSVPQRPIQFEQQEREKVVLRAPVKGELKSRPITQKALTQEVWTPPQKPSAWRVEFESPKQVIVQEEQPREIFQVEQQPRILQEEVLLEPEHISQEQQQRY